MKALFIILLVVIIVEIYILAWVSTGMRYRYENRFVNTFFKPIIWWASKTDI